MAKKTTKTTAEVAVTPDEGSSEMQIPVAQVQKKPAAKMAVIPAGILAKAEVVQAGKYGHGLKLVAALGDDFAEVMRAAGRL